MRTVEFACYYLASPRNKRYPSGWKMSPEDAAARGLTPDDKVPGTSELRAIPQTDEERRRAQVHYQSAGRDSVQPPRS